MKNKRVDNKPGGGNLYESYMTITVFTLFIYLSRMMRYYAVTAVKTEEDHVR
ncbi:MAG: hypothetical protein QXS02_06770 [Candidatus Thermoplasmatota archaeon]